MREIKHSSRFFADNIIAAADKSITHRAVMLLSRAEGGGRISNALLSEDTLATAECMRRLGADISIEGSSIFVRGNRFCDAPSLYAANSGTTMRLLAGLIAGSGVRAVISGDASLSKRPMDRVLIPLRQMNAHIESDGYAPLKIFPSELTGITYRLPVASAQVKSAVLLAGLCAGGRTTVIEDIPSRNHTEIMLKAMGADIVTDGGSTTVRKSRLQAADIEVPADISSAAYSMVLAAISKEAKATVRNVGVNFTRSGILDIFDRAGVSYRLSNQRESCGEKIADITVESGKIRPFEISGAIIPRLIDEIPVLSVLACFAQGKTVIRDAQELKVKESDRIALMTDNLHRFGAKAEVMPDGLIIHGQGGLKGGASADGRGDHRIAMSMAIAARASEEGGAVMDDGSAAVSYPGFFDLFSERL